MDDAPLPADLPKVQGDVQFPSGDQIDTAKKALTDGWSNPVTATKSRQPEAC